VQATIMLFSLIAFWSRLPGVCIYEPISFIYLMDFVDIFSIIISIYINPVYGAVFSLVWNLYPRLAGAYKTWPAIAKDSAIQAFVTLLCPLFFAIWGSLAAVVIIYSVLRFVLYWILNIFVPTRGFVEQTIRLIISGVALFFINMLYTQLFGDFFVSLMQEGASFSWALFFIATAVIIVFSVAVFGFSPKKAGKKAIKNVARIVKHQIHRAEAPKLDQDKEDMRLIRDSFQSKDLLQGEDLYQGKRMQ